MNRSRSTNDIFFSIIKSLKEINIILKGVGVMLNVLVVDDVRISKVCFDGEDNLNNLNPENVNAVVEVT